MNTHNNFKPEILAELRYHDKNKAQLKEEVVYLHHKGVISLEEFDQQSIMIVKESRRFVDQIISH